MAEMFDINKVYTKRLTKKELIKMLNRCYDKEFIVTWLPRTEDNADILVRSLDSELNSSKNNKT